MKYLLEIIAALAAHLAGKDAELTSTQNSSNSTYPGAIDPAAEPGAQFLQTSAPFYPSPWMNGQGEWADAYAKAKDFVSQLTLLEKVNLTTGVGWEGEQCVGQVSILFLIKAITF
jgi:beta-glucosidase